MEKKQKYEIPELYISDIMCRIPFLSVSEISNIGDPKMGVQVDDWQKAGETGFFDANF